MGIIDKIEENKRAKHLKKKVEDINKLATKFQSMSNEELREASDKLFARRQNGESEASLMTEAYALIREVSKRTLGIEQYDVQLKGAVSIAEGNLAEMATGEGKTFVVPLVAYLHALEGKNVHVITSNEYLAKRDKELMSKLFGFLGITVGLSTAGMTIEKKKKAYNCNITYTTAPEVGFDYLRDNAADDLSKRVLNGLNSVIIDEADHALLDDATTQLIVSNPAIAANDDVELLKKAAAFIETLDTTDYRFEFADSADLLDDYDDPAKKAELSNAKPSKVFFTDDGYEKLEATFGIDLAAAESGSLHILSVCQNALKAKFLLKRGIDYIVSNKAIKIIGQTTGRNMDGRQYSRGMHQAVEAKEGVKISDYSYTVARIDYQHFFRMYDNLGGMSGTCKSDEDELQSIYRLSVDKIETNKPIRRKDEHFYFYHTTEAKEKDMFELIKKYHEAGRPILIGTSSVEMSERLARTLKEAGYDVDVLNAKNEEKESKIVAQAGRKGRITVATNMAGRGTDIKLGGDPTQLAIEEMANNGYSAELISFAFSCLDPETPEQEEARKTFKKLESKYKEITDKEKKEVEASGGLAVIGTCLNPSKRIDDQLRGRAGRQGELGSSEFFVSWDDIAGKNGIEGAYVISDYARDYYSSLVKKLDKNKQITDPNVLGFIEEIQHIYETQCRSSREQNCKLSDLESNHRLAFYSAKQVLIKRLDTFDPNAPLPEAFMQTVHCWAERKASSIINEYEYKKKTDPAAAYEKLKNDVGKYNIEIESSSIGTPEKIKQKELEDYLYDQVYSAIRSFIRELDSVSKDEKDVIKNAIRASMVRVCNSAWIGHLSRIDDASVQLQLSSDINDHALQTYVSSVNSLYRETIDSIQDICVDTIVDKALLYLTDTKKLTQEKNNKSSRKAYSKAPTI